MNDAVKWLEPRLPELETALAALVNINSFTDNTAGGNQVGELLREVFTIEGLTARVVPSEQYASHLVFSSKGRAGEKPVGLIGHLDTVFPPGVFEGYRVDGDLRRGPGVLDMKGGLVVIAWALKALAATRGLAALPPLKTIIVSDEEVGSFEGAPLIRAELAGAQAALTFESGRANDAIVTSRKGTGNLDVTAKGKAAHAGNNHQDGANAAWALARFIDKAQGLTDYARGVTVNVGKIAGGHGKNTVPDHAVAELDLRFVTRVDAEWLVKSLFDAAAEAAASVPGTTLTCVGGANRLPMERTDANLKLFEAYAQHAKAYGLAASESPRVGGGSDACTTSAMGIASIDALGPRGKGFHTKDEHIEVKTLIPRAQALAAYLSSL
ncbi:MAG: M20 family metallopeptidase [Archangiaceae bacterium]|nr:M20 family metallopeptidase [Archangiaceae bacterium]